ncbi:MAG: hypothetical protein GXP49_07815 [Deltaproteobacteria bacterium]|nr:hypothetical protein [Deltaproteobacteria bacterium]
MVEIIIKVIRRSLAAIFIIIFISSAAGNAAVMIPLTLADLVLGSDAVVICRIQTARSFWGKDQKRIYTDYRLEVKQVISGKIHDGPVLVRKLGGILGKIGMAVPGSGKLEIGKSYVLFLKKIRNIETREKNSTVYVTRGMAQGIYRIEKKSTGTNDFFAIHELSGAIFISSPAKSSPASTTTAGDDKKDNDGVYTVGKVSPQGNRYRMAPAELKLEDLINQVRQAVGDKPRARDNN